MAVDLYATNSMELLIHRLRLLGKALSLLCCLWIAVVGTLLVGDLTPNDLEHHRAPIVQERVGKCEGEFSQRYACTDTILQNGQKAGLSELLARLGTTFLLPSVAWVMWHAIMLRAERLR